MNSIMLHCIDECLLFVVECDAWVIATLVATLNQGGTHVTFASRTLQESEVLYPAFKKRLLQ